MVCICIARTRNVWIGLSGSLVAVSRKLRAHWWSYRMKHRWIYKVYKHDETFTLTPPKARRTKNSFSAPSYQLISGQPSYTCKMQESISALRSTLMNSDFVLFSDSIQFNLLLLCFTCYHSSIELQLVTL